MANDRASFSVQLTLDQMLQIPMYRRYCWEFIETQVSAGMTTYGVTSISSFTHAAGSELFHVLAYKPDPTRPFHRQSFFRIL
jgi:hypothetical protein